MPTKEELKQQIKQLKQQRENYPHNPGMQNELSARIAEIEAQLTQMQAEEEKQQQVIAEQNHEERVQTAKDEFATYIADSLAEDGLTPEEIFVGEVQQHLYTIKCSQAFNALVSKMSAQISGAEERELQLRRQNDDLQDKIEAAEAQIRQMTNDLQEANLRANKFEFERNEANKNRDNAATALEEARTEIDRLESQVDDLRKEIAVGARNAYKVEESVDTAEQIAQLVKKIKESRIKVINMKPVEGDFKRSTWQAEDAATGELYTFNHLEKGKYLELTPEEGYQFRLEHQAQVPNLPLDEPVQITPPPLEDITRDQFRESTDDLEEPSTSAEDGAGENEESAGEGNDQQLLSAEVEALKQTVSALTADVEGLKRRVGWVA